MRIGFPLGTEEKPVQYVFLGTGIVAVKSNQNTSRDGGIPVPLSKTRAELLFEFVSQRYERAAVLIISNLPFDEWTETFGSERLTGALLDRLTHRVHILEMNGESFRLNHSRARKTVPTG